MNWQYTPYSIPLFLAALAGMLLARAAWRRRAVPGGRAAMWLMIAASEWCLTYGLELTFTNMAWQRFWSNTEYLGITTVPVIWFSFAMAYTGRREWLTRRRIALLLIVPAISLLFIWTNPYHRLFWAESRQSVLAGHVILREELGPAFWLHTAYSYVLLMLGSFILLRMVLRAASIYRGQALTLLACVILPWAANGLYLFVLHDRTYVDLTPFAFFLIGPPLVLGALRFRMFDIVPVAREAIIEGMPDPMLILDPYGRVADLNPAAEALFGVRTATAVGEPVAAALGAFPEVVAYCSRGEALDADCVIAVNAERRFFDLHISILPVSPEDARIQVITLRDITERRQMQDELRASQERYRLLIENAGDPIFVLNAEGRFLLVNSTMARVLGRPLQALQDKTVYEVATSTAFAREQMAVARQVIASGQERHHEVTVALQDEERIFSCNMQPVRNIEGRVYATQIIARDVTAMRRAEQALRESERFLRLVLDSSPNGIFVKKSDGCYVLVNQAMAEFLGTTPEAIEGRTADELMAQLQFEWRHLEEHLAQDRRVADGKQTMGQGEVMLASVDGERRWFQTSQVPLTLGGESDHVLEVWSDVTLRRRAAEERERLIAELESALANIKTLKGLLPICAVCKKIRDDSGYWNQLETYIAAHSEADFTHGICPDCIERLYPGVMDDDAADHEGAAPGVPQGQG